MHTGHVSLPMHTGHVSLPMHTGHVSLPMYTGHVSLPMYTGHVSLPMHTGLCKFILVLCYAHCCEHKVILRNHAVNLINYFSQNLYLHQICYRDALTKYTYSFFCKIQIDMIVTIDMKMCACQCFHIYHSPPAQRNMYDWFYDENSWEEYCYVRQYKFISHVE